MRKLLTLTLLGVAAVACASTANAKALYLAGLKIPYELRAAAGTVNKCVNTNSEQAICKVRAGALFAGAPVGASVVSYNRNQFQLLHIVVPKANWNRALRELRTTFGQPKVARHVAPAGQSLLIAEWQLDHMNISLSPTPSGLAIYVLRNSKRPEVQLPGEIVDQ